MQDSHKNGDHANMSEEILNHLIELKLAKKLMGNFLMNPCGKSDDPSTYKRANKVLDNS